IRFGHQRIENENAHSVVAHLYSADPADRDRLPRGDDRHCATHLPVAGEWFTRDAERETDWLKFACSKIRIAALLLAATIWRRFCDASIGREQQRADQRRFEKGDRRTPRKIW